MKHQVRVRSCLGSLCSCKFADQESDKNGFQRGCCRNFVLRQPAARKQVTLSLGLKKLGKGGWKTNYQLLLLDLHCTAAKV